MEDIVFKMPKTESESASGINEAGIETYKNVPILSLTKEELQNSTDGAKDKDGESTKVVVEFSDFEVETKNIPDLQGLIQVYNDEKDYWDAYQQNDKRPVDFFKDGIKLLNKEKIRCLRISDYNTTGLRGINSKQSSPWKNLVVNRFVSDKPRGKSGSFGIGKDAAFACSSVRTVFYNTINDEDESAFQGVAKLPSYQKGGQNFVGLGFFSKDDGSKKTNPIMESRSLEPGYIRKEYGMDKYILGFNSKLSKEDLKKQLVISSIQNFLYAFWNNTLEVKCDDLVINQDTLNDLFIKYSEDIDKRTKEYYETLKQPDDTLYCSVFDENDTIIKYKLDKDYSRRAAIVKRSGMKVFDKGNIDGRIGFAALIILAGEKVNGYFKELENAEHTEWSDFRATSESEAKNKQSIFFDRLRQAVRDASRADYSDAIDADGMNEYLPYTYQEAGTNHKDEGLTNQVEKKKKRAKKNRKKPAASFTEEEFSYEVDELGNIIEDTVSVRIGQGQGGGGDNPTPGNDPQTDPDGDPTAVKPSNNFVSRKQIPNENFSFRLKKDNLNSEYNLKLMSSENISKGFIEVALSGEQSIVDTTIASAHVDGIPTEFRGNKVLFESFKANEPHQISFTLTDKGEWALEVSVHESKN